ncbi:hypothetical protein [Aridibaculum aurantiacum]|uniref:hypothetical protein n=1 Tax=Aridibaculum aurantiacum TaxID=2810307 RepID=UPI001A96E0B2|nr:hypothetical protein [Aridibaculum aurantiacum]
MAKKIYQWLLAIQGIYCLVTAVWPLIHLKSFLTVTGPKTDIWLLETVSVLILAIAVLLLLHLLYLSPVVPVAVMAIVMSAGLLFIDVYYPSVSRIADVYLADAIMQALFLLLWLYILVVHKQVEKNLQAKKK